MCSLSQRKLKTLRCLKSVRIWSYSGPYFPTFGLKQKDIVYISVFSAKTGKYGPEKL